MAWVLDDAGEEYISYLKSCEVYGTEPLDYGEYFEAMDELRRLNAALDEIGYETDRETWERHMKPLYELERRLGI